MNWTSVKFLFFKNCFQISLIKHLKMYPYFSLLIEGNMLIENRYLVGTKKYVVIDFNVCTISKATVNKLCIF